MSRTCSRISVGLAIATCCLAATPLAMAQLPADDADSSFDSSSFIGNNSGVGFGAWEFLEPAGTPGSAFKNNTGAQLEGARSWGIASGSGDNCGYAVRRLLSTWLTSGSVTLRMRHNVGNYGGFSGFNLRQADQGSFGNQELLSVGLRPVYNDMFGHYCVAVGGSVDKQIWMGVDLRGRRLEYTVTWNTLAGTYQVTVRDIDNPGIFGAAAGCLKFTTGIGVQSIGFGNFNCGISQDLLFDSLKVNWSGAIADSFDPNDPAGFSSPYVAGSEIGSKNGGRGFADAWTTAATPGNQITSPGLTYSLLKSSGHKVRAFIDGSPNSSRQNFHRLHRSFGQSTAAGDGNHDIWIAFLGQKASGLDGNTYAGLSLFDNSEAGSAERLFIGKRFGQSVWGIERPNYYPTPAGNSSVAFSSTVHLIVAKISVNNGYDNDVVRLFIDPCLSGAQTEPDNSTAAVTLGPSAGFDFNFDRIRIVAGNGNNSADALEWNLDELRIGTQFAEVAPATLTGPNPLCQDSGGNLFAGPSGASSYSWTSTASPAGGSGSIIGSTVGQTASLSVGGPGSFLLNLVVTDSGLCRYFADKVVSIAPTPPCSIAGPDAVCAKSTGNVYSGPGPSAGSTCGSLSYSWSVSGGTITAGQTSQNVTISAGSGSTMIVALTITDNATGLTCSSTKTVTMRVTYPTVSCPPPANVQCPADIPPATSLAAFLNQGGTASDECGGVLTLSYMGDASTGSGCGTDPMIITRTYRIRNAAGRCTDCAQTITAADTIPPVLTVPPDVTIECPEDCEANPGSRAGYATATDNCTAQPAIKYIETEGRAPCPSASERTHVYTRTWIATDACGNSTNGDQIVTVPDTKGPNIVLNGDNPATVECHTSYTDAGASANDDCDGSRISAIETNNPVKPDVPGSYTVTYTVSDACGNAMSATRTVNVVDTTPPTIEVLGDNPATVECHGSYSDAGATASDSCAGVLSGTIETSNPVNVNEPGSYTVTYTVTDAGSNTTAATRTVKVVDTTAPSLTLPADVVVSTDSGQCSAVVSFMVSASDACDPAPTVLCKPPSGSVFPKGVTTVQCGVEDAAGNHPALSSFTVTVNDREAPVLSVLGANPETVEGGTPYAEPGAVALDACAGDLTAAIEISSSVNPNATGTYTTTYRVRDLDGNTATASRTVKVVDTTPPVITPADVEVSAEPGQCSAVVGFTVAASDTCDPAPAVVCTPASGSVFPQGDTTVHCTATDAAGNQSSSSFKVTVNDTEPPVITVLGENPVTIPAHSPYDDAGATALDNCGGDLTAEIERTGPVEPDEPRAYIVTYTVQDAAGNTATATRVVSVEEVTPPVITCPPDLVVPTDPGQCSAAVNFTVTATDASGAAVPVVCSPPSGSVFGPGAHTVTCTAANAAGSASCSFTVTVLPALQVVFRPPLESGAGVVNRFQVGSTIPHKVQLLDCNGNDVTAAMGPLVTVKLDATERQQEGGSSVLVVDVPEDYTGVGDAGGRMVLTDGQFQFNLKTTESEYETGTVNNTRFFQSAVTVTYDTSPGTTVGSGVVILESKQ
ncbi:MAG: immunoglobulin-like domain-containing protein [Verrucomicrobiota bacterium]